MCGEQGKSSWRLAPILGSPPRVRGTALEPGHGVGDVRITPACAGNRSSVRAWVCQVTDHPRVCGEQCWHVRPFIKHYGSPPRVRGTVGPEVVTQLADRITPACAGNSIFAFSSATAFKDHPRVCGEQKLGQRLIRGSWGSPPRVRGTDQMHKPCRLRDRITPACAGNSGALSGWRYP